ncbi:hypothetical protein ACWDXT_08115 [Streptomyces sp. NPDC003236]|uniref:hypothetical protein n=1 Tax=Streptomyces sp. NPDC093248 TaxID=3155072 RepID=UPI00342D7A3D
MRRKRLGLAGALADPGLPFPGEGAALPWGERLTPKRACSALLEALRQRAVT